MEKDNRNSSEDILTRLSLLTDDVNVNSIKGWPYINLGEFFQKDYPEMFSALKLGINIKKCNISIHNVESYCFYDDEGNFLLQKKILYMKNHRIKIFHICNRRNF